MRRKVAIITGSATGVGSATAVHLAQSGWNVVINYTKSEQEADETAEKCRSAGAEGLVLKGDVSDDIACRQIVADTVAKWGHIDALVNNAGTTRACRLSDLEGVTADDFIHLYRVNVLSAFQMARAAAPYLKQSRGAVVNVASIAALNGMGSSIAYTSSKGAMVTLTLSLAHALAPEVRVNAVCPGFIQGRWTRGFLGDRYEEVRSDFEQAAALKVTATPEDIADAIAFYCTRGAIMTGQVTVVDGGSTLGSVTLGRR